MENLNKQHDQIELRSEKVRNIIGRIPHILVRIGTSLFFLIITSFICASIFITYNPTIETTGTIYPKQNSVACYIDLPSNQYKIVSIGNHAIINVDNVPYLGSFTIPGVVLSISDQIRIGHNGGFVKAKIQIPDTIRNESGSIINIADSINVRVFVYGDKISYFSYVLDLFFRRNN
ncbi:MAG: hypothetical protein PHU27_02015 [Salinivirgaceae bacterium]|nr:hypothetical protein [Salinivirgaceae bacterium]MDD4746633.1 hypothetical protein [Salinivirgaceae bacterium]MDY0279779.1 hypothetical protein [Salinivirgaceae bacterium]